MKLCRELVILILVRPVTKQAVSCTAVVLSCCRAGIATRQHDTMTGYFPFGNYRGNTLFHTRTPLRQVKPIIACARVPVCGRHATLVRTNSLGLIFQHSELPSNSDYLTGQGVQLPLTDEST